MGGYLEPDIGDELNEFSILGLAHVGDAVFELMVRSWLCVSGASTAKGLHNGAVALVSAGAQAAAAERLMPELSDDERAVFRRGRNARVNSVPQGSSHEEYHAATGLEALFGYLFLSGRRDRLEELFGKVINQFHPESARRRG